MSHPNQRLIDMLAAIDEVAAIALGGSRAGGVNDDASDYDLYVLTTGRIDPDVRERIVRKVADDARYEIAIPWWGDEDALSIGGIRYELAWFDVNWFFDGIDAVVNQHRASQGYSPPLACGQKTSGRWRIISHFSALTGMPGPAQGAE